ncbi:NPCBM/NEW2 domain-containing protein [candidate division KSB1 bacterium]
MKRPVFFYSFLCLISIVLITPFSAAAQQIWPHPVPCRVQDSVNPDLFIMTLGNVSTSLADGMFDPVRDEVRLNNGIVLRNYFRDSLRVEYYEPIDKSIFPLPPSGWCSWYFYYYDLDENEVMLNARWINENLKDYGALYVQIDDGWQRGETVGTRDWTHLHDYFKSGMDVLADNIKSQGLIPGIWLAPHGQSNETLVKNTPNVFMFRPDGTSASDTWEGKFLVDPTTPETHQYLTDLFTKFREYGYEYYKIDGQPIVAREYRGKQEFMKDQSGDGNELYRKTLETIKDAIGPESFLLGCWGIPVEGAGIMDGSRTGGDVDISWSGFMGALSATMRYYYQHNIMWYTDPDVMLLRYPLTTDQARTWATLQGLTGQGLLTSDRLPDLGEERVEMLKSVYPAVDIRPLDLFPARGNKRIWDLKINHLDRNYDVVGVFNFDSNQKDRIYLCWKDLGLSETTPMHVFDFWNKEYMGVWEAGMIVDLAPTSCRVLSLVPDNGEIQVVSTNRHITQGWVDLISMNYDKNITSMEGRSNIIKNDPYEIRFAFPKGQNFRVRQVTASTALGSVPVSFTNHQFWASVQITSPQTTEVTWEVGFEPADHYHYAVKDPTGLRVRREGFEGAEISWSSQYYLNVGYQVYLNGKLLGYTPTTSFPLRGLDPNKRHVVGVRTVWEDGALSEGTAEQEFSLYDMIPAEVYLTDLEPVPVSSGRGGFGMGRDVTTGTISIDGNLFERGIRIGANTVTAFDLNEIFSSMEARFGVDDAATAGADTVNFIIVGDEKELWRSGTMTKSDGIQSVQVDIRNVRRLTLQVTGSRQGGQRGGQRGRQRSSTTVNVVGGKVIK